MLFLHDVTLAAPLSTKGIPTLLASTTSLLIFRLLPSLFRTWPRMVLTIPDYSGSVLEGTVAQGQRPPLGVHAVKVQCCYAVSCPAGSDPNSKHRFPPPSSKLFQNWLRHWLLFISAHLSTDTVNTLQKTWALIRLWKQRSVQAHT